MNDNLKWATKLALEVTAVSSTCCPGFALALGQCVDGLPLQSLQIRSLCIQTPYFVAETEPNLPHVNKGNQAQHTQVSGT